MIFLLEGVKVIGSDRKIGGVLVCYFGSCFYLYFMKLFVVMVVFGVVVSFDKEGY